MKFEEKLKKRFIKQLDKDVPNPYQKKKFSLWPLWAKIALPVGSLVLTGSIVAAIVVPNINKNNVNINVLENPIDNSGDNGGGTKPDDTKPNDGGNESGENGGNTGEDNSYVAVFDALTVGAPKTTNKLPSLDSSFVNRTAMKTIQNLEDYFKKSQNKDCVLSPASYLLTASALAAVSDGFDLEAFGLEDAGEDTKDFLEALNCSLAIDEYNTCEYDAGVLHQQVGPNFAFDDKKRAQVSDYYIGTAIADLDNYNKQAEQYFAKKVNLSIPIPDPGLNGSGIITYGALKMHDHCGYLYSADNWFRSDGKEDTVPTAVISGTTDVFRNDKFLAFKLHINSTSLAIVLPNEGISLESISLSEAYDSLLNGTFTSVTARGYIPYFHLKSTSVDLTKNYISKLNGSEQLYSKLLKQGVFSSSVNLTCLQSSDYKFFERGIDAETITCLAMDESEPNKEFTDLCVNRPFYALTLRDNFPLFICKVNNPLIYD